MLRERKALQCLVDCGLDRNRIPGICEDIVSNDDDERWAALLAYLHKEGKTNIDPMQVIMVDGSLHLYCLSNANIAPETCNYLDESGNEYLVLNEDEANAAAKEAIENDFKSFNCGYLARITGVPYDVFLGLHTCADANEAIKATINFTYGLANFIYEAVSEYGRSHFISKVDGCEHEVFAGDKRFYIYRVK